MNLERNIQKNAFLYRKRVPTSNKRQLINLKNEGSIMWKRLFVFLMCCFFAANNTYARFPDRQDAGSYIVVLKEPSLSRIMLDKQGRSLYKGIAARSNRDAERVGRRRAKMEERLSRFENRLKSAERLCVKDSIPA
jgi:hypothetical protein